MITFLVCFVSVALFAQGMFSLHLMLYSWEHPERLLSSQAPRSYLKPRFSFTVLLPARHEEAVIYETIKKVWSARYPSDLLEIVVICYMNDEGTIAEARRAINDIRSPHVRLETFFTQPINKPHGLNVGLQCSSNQVVTIFDAEDDIDPNIFNMINTVMIKEGVGIVQAGVQLMNFSDHWFGIHNCLEYFFWFKSRLHFHAKVGMIPLGGNTIFILRDLLTRIGGWDEQCLTEDAEIGLRLSVLREPIRVIYDARHVTREETPDSYSCICQTTYQMAARLFASVMEGNMACSSKVPSAPARPLYIIVSLYSGTPYVDVTSKYCRNVVLESACLVAMIAFMPLYALLLQCVVNVIGAFIFAKEYKLKISHI